MPSRWIVAGVACALAAAEPAIHYAPAGPGGTVGRFELRGLPAGAAVPAVTVRVEGENGRPADAVMLGTSGVAGGVSWFRPRFPLVPGVRYHAAAGDVRAVVSLPVPDAGAPVRVTDVFPSGDRLPENLLKVYVHFSAPVKRGEAYRRVRLLDASGKPVADPFLELDEELWDPAGLRLTLLIDPGRIKRGLKPREDVGPVLEAGKSYTLEIDRNWADLAGRPLGAAFRKPFRAVAPDATRPDPAGWKVAPPAGPDGVLEVRFDAPLDRALAERAIWVTGPGGGRVAGRVELADAETRWRFRPDAPWRPGEYRLHAGPDLEDLAGNRPDRLFDAEMTAGTAPAPVRPRAFSVPPARP
jgi:hypothetical protein